MSHVDIIVRTLIMNGQATTSDYVRLRDYYESRGFSFSLNRKRKDQQYIPRRDMKSKDELVHKVDGEFSDQNKMPQLQDNDQHEQEKDSLSNYQK